MKNVSSIEIAAAYLHGRHEVEIEAYAKAIKCSSTELAARIGALHLGLPTQQSVDVAEVSSVRVQTARVGKRLRKVEKRSGAHSDGAHKGTSTVKASKIKSYWAKMTKAQRKAEMARRVAKRNKKTDRKSVV